MEEKNFTDATAADSFLKTDIGYPFNYRDFLFIDIICSKLSAAELSYERKG